MGVDRPTRLLWFVTFVHLPFSVGSLDILVALLVFMKDTSCPCRVIRRNFKYSRAVRSCGVYGSVYGKLFEVIGLHFFRCYLHVASPSVTPL